MFESLVNSIPAPDNKPDEVYVKDGLLYCVECNTPRQTRIQIFGTEKTVYCMCVCQSRAEKEKDLNLKSKISEEAAERARRMAVDDPEFINHTFSNDNGHQPEIAKCKLYADDFENKRLSGSGLLLFGDCGTGKSFSADCIANKLIDKGFPVLITKFSKISDAVTSAPFEEKGAYFSSILKYPLLIIDDLGAERETEYMMELINRVIDERERSGKPMIITTNVSWKDISEPVSKEWSRIWSRILKRCYPIKFKGDDMRKIEGMERINSLSSFYESSVS